MLQGKLIMCRNLVQKIKVQLYNTQPKAQEKKVREIHWEIRILKRMIYMENFKVMHFLQERYVLRKDSKLSVCTDP